MKRLIWFMKRCRKLVLDVRRGTGLLHKSHRFIPHCAYVGYREFWSSTAQHIVKLFVRSQTLNFSFTNRVVRTRFSVNMLRLFGVMTGSSKRRRWTDHLEDDLCHSDLYTLNNDEL